MASTRETFHIAIRELLGPAWEAIDRPDGTLLLSVREVAEVGRVPLEAYRSDPRVPLEQIMGKAREMLRRIDPHGAEHDAHRERRIAELAEEVTRLKGEVAGAKAIVADLFERARGEPTR